MKTEHGTVESVPYVGDTEEVPVSRCAECDWANIYKGHTEKHAAKALAEHHATKHGKRDNCQAIG